MIFIRLLSCLQYVVSWARQRGIDLIEDLLVGEVPEDDGIGRTLGAAEPVPLAERRVHLCLPARGRLRPADRAIAAGRDARAAGHAVAFLDAADGAGGGNRVLR
jgi:hypothetical protein